MTTKEQSMRIASAYLALSHVFMEVAMANNKEQPNSDEEFLANKYNEKAKFWARKAYPLERPV